ncbi:hypothetical protein CIB93_07265 [Streptomyces sp. WZ.A104]|nr:hypothetical protein CIB93_07265 [Streptomyces sp. WZ.A104]
MGELQVAPGDHTGIDVQVLTVDALLRELGVRGLAQLHSDLHGGVWICHTNPDAEGSSASTIRARGPVRRITAGARRAPAMPTKVWGRKATPVAGAP